MSRQIKKVVYKNMPKYFVSTSTEFFLSIKNNFSLYCLNCLACVSETNFRQVFYKSLEIFSNFFYKFSTNLYYFSFMSRASRLVTIVLSSTFTSGWVWRQAKTRPLSQPSRPWSSTITW